MVNTATAHTHIHTYITVVTRQRRVSFLRRSVCVFLAASFIIIFFPPLSAELFLSLSLFYASAVYFLGLHALTLCATPLCILLLNFVSIIIENSTTCVLSGLCILSLLCSPTPFFLSFFFGGYFSVCFLGMLHRKVGRVLCHIEIER